MNLGEKSEPRRTRCRLANGLPSVRASPPLVLAISALPPTHASDFSLCLAFGFIANEGRERRRAVVANPVTL